MPGIRHHRHKASRHKGEVSIWRETKSSEIWRASGKGPDFWRGSRNAASRAIQEGWDHAAHFAPVARIGTARKGGAARRGSSVYRGPAEESRANERAGREDRGAERAGSWAGGQTTPRVGPLRVTGGRKPGPGIAGEPPRCEVLADERPMCVARTGAVAQRTEGRSLRRRSAARVAAARGGGRARPEGPEAARPARP